MNCFFSYLTLHSKYAFILHDSNCLNVGGFAYSRNFEQVAAVDFDTNLKFEVVGRKDPGHLQRLDGRSPGATAGADQDG